MASPIDYYEILQVSPNADDDVIQAAYKRLAFKWHPDKQPGNESAAEKMKQLNLAYEVLSSPQKRRQYDLRRQARVEEAIPDETPAPPTPPRRKKIRKGPNDRLRKKKPIDIRGDSVVQGLAVCLVGMSFADLLMTYLLLRTGSQFYEANPIALWFFNRWNILGMTLFKFVIVGLVIGLAEVIERSRQRWGRLLLVAACGATGYAVVRGLRLYVGFED